jgi:hypothetical protein
MKSITIMSWYLFMNKLCIHWSAFGKLNIKVKYQWKVQFQNKISMEC